MKKFISVLTLLSISISAHAGYWRCEGKKEVIGFASGHDGLILSATNKGSEISANLFSGKPKMSGITFEESGKALHEVSSVLAQDYFEIHEATLNISKGNFQIVDLSKRKIIYKASNLKCDYSDGE